MSELDRQTKELEFILKAGRTQDVTVVTLFQVLLRSPVWVLLNREPAEDDGPGDVEPLIIQGDEGEELLLLFSDERHMEPARQKAPEYEAKRRVPAAALLDKTSSRVGVVLNPSTDYGAYIPADVLHDLKKHFGHGFLENIPTDEEAPGQAGG